MIESSYVISFLLVFLCLLAGLDLWRQVAIKDEALWEQTYSNAVQFSQSFWNFGFQLEDLEMKIASQHGRFQSILHNIDVNLLPRFILGKQSLRSNIQNIEFTRKSRILLHGIEQNDTEVFQIRCEKDGPQLRVGLNDYRTDARDECQVFTSPKVEEHIGPQFMFDLIPLPDSREYEGAFALKYIGNGMYLRVVPPPSDNTRAPWKLVIGGPSIGAGETFRITNEGYLYSALMGGYFTCAAGQIVSGYGDPYGRGNHFVLDPVPKDAMITSYALVDLSKKISQIQSSYLLQWENDRKARPKRRPIPIHSPADKSIAIPYANFTASVDNSPNSHNVEDGITKIALAIPMTSKGTEMKDVLDSPFWNNIFDSFMRSIDWRSNKYQFRFYIGFDRADDKYDLGDAWGEFREEFKHRAIFRMSEQMMDEEMVAKVLQSQLSLKLMHFDHLESAPSQIVSQLVVTAHHDGFDYFYQVNDDTIFETPNWAPKFIAILRDNAFVPNFGVTGPVDTNNEKIFTHAFIHRTHIEVFGHLFPTSFKNWWSDDWISTVYGSKHTFRCADVSVKHNVHGQKTGDINRYQVDKSAQFSLENELRLGHAKVDEWLKKNSLPRLPLPEVCGYIPTVKYIAHKVVDNKIGDEIKASL